VLNEYAEIKESLVRENPSLSHDNLERLATVAFEDKYTISHEKAQILDQEKQWQRWLAKHSEPKNNVVISEQVKAIEDEHGRYVTFDLITSDVDQSSKAHDQKYDDLISPEAIKSAEYQLKGSIIDMIDPTEHRDFKTVVQEGAKYGGLEHEHVYTNQDIVPALIIDNVKAIDNNTKLRVTAKVNEDSRRAENVWSMIKNKVLKYASVEYKSMKDHYTEMSGKIVRVIDDIMLGGFTLTSKGRNASCGISGFFVKALPESDLSLNEDNNSQENKMTEEEVKEEVKNEEPPVEEKKEETPETPAEEVKEESPDEVKSLRDELDEVKSLVETLKAERDQLKSLEDDKALVSKFGDHIKDSVKAALEAEQKVLVEADQKKFEEIETAKDSVKAILKEKGVDAAWAEVGKKHNELHSQKLI